MAEREQESGTRGWRFALIGLAVAGVLSLGFARQEDPPPDEPSEAVEPAPAEEPVPPPPAEEPSPEPVDPSPSEESPETPTPAPSPAPEPEPDPATPSEPGEALPESPDQPARPIAPPEAEEPPPDPPDLGDLVRVTMLSGTTVDGVLKEASLASIVIRVGDVDLPMRRRDLLSIEKRPSARQEFYALRAKVPDYDIKRRMELVAWARQRELYETALIEIYDILEKAGDLAIAREELATLTTLIRMRDEAEARKATRSPAAPASPAGGEDAGDVAEDDVVGPGDTWKRFGPSEFPVLGEADINLIKVYEIDLNDPGCNVIITPETVAAIVRDYAGHELIPDTRAGRDAFRRLPEERILDVLFRLQAREYYSQVKVVGHPTTIEQFRPTMKWLVSSCASTACHGGKAGGRFLLRRADLNSDATIYTNFAIVTRFTLRDGTPFINWDDPGSSPMLQMAMGRHEAVIQHPDVPGWRAVFRNRDSRIYERAVAWIMSMYRPRPIYDLDYTPPGEAAEPADPLPTAPETTPVER